jgi:hypothetical protein
VENAVLVADRGTDASRVRRGLIGKRDPSGPEASVKTRQRHHRFQGDNVGP